MIKGIIFLIVGVVGVVIIVVVKWESVFIGVKKINDEMVDFNGKVIYFYDDLEKGFRDLVKELFISYEEIVKVVEVVG